jgi:aryl-alcohol dehydrogenase-like predicted oxidoreductase
MDPRHGCKKHRSPYRAGGLSNNGREAEPHQGLCDLPLMIYEHNPQATKEWGRLGLGTGTLASLGRAASLSEARALLDAMESLGVCTIDTADTYGSGDCERLLANALAGRRERFRIITKGGYCHSNLSGPLRPFNQFLKKAIQRWGTQQCFDIAYLRNCLEHSLRRLRTGHVETYLLHDPPETVVRSAEIAAFFDRIREEGKALQAGVSSSDPAVLRAALDCSAYRVIECPCNIRAAPKLATIWSSCSERGIHVVGNHVYDPGCLRLPQMTHEILMRASAGLLPTAATIICGTRRPEHLHSSWTWSLRPLPAEEARRLCAGAASA